jgi:hypothetical protein
MPLSRGRLPGVGRCGQGFAPTRAPAVPQPPQFVPLGKVVLAPFGLRARPPPQENLDSSAKLAHFPHISRGMRFNQ